jgi:hypothetical protein
MPMRRGRVDGVKKNDPPWAQLKEFTMLPQPTITSQILKALRRSSDIELDELVSSLPTLGWNQIFLEVDRLSRTGAVRVTSKGGLYWLSLGPVEKG